jgi:hypothetical protein
LNKNTALNLIPLDELSALTLQRNVLGMKNIKIGLCQKPMTKTMFRPEVTTLAL